MLGIAQRRERFSIVGYEQDPGIFLLGYKRERIKALIANSNQGFLFFLNGNICVKFLTNYMTHYIIGICQ